MIHIIQQLTNPYGGSEIHALELARVLGQHTSVQLWSEFDPSPLLTAQWPISLIRPKRLSFPKTGTFVFVGACWYVGPWLDFTFPRRIIVLHNYPHDSYQHWFKRARSPWLPALEWFFASEQMRKDSGLDGLVEPSPIDIKRFSPRGFRQTTCFTVGRLSRDTPQKFHSDDPDLYLRLAEAGVRVRIMGGLNLRCKLPSHPLIELIPEGAEPPEEFLASLDCFLYRTHADWFEAFGRVVLEAMACGLPVVCGSSGGYADEIENGRNGFLFDDNEAAFRQVLALRDDFELRACVGRRAREKAVSLYGDGLPKHVLEEYLR